LTAYAAAARIPVRVYAPETTPTPILETIRTLGADLQLVVGHIGDAGKQARAFAAESGYFDVSTLREPYRIEGKKTMGIEVAEQLGWSLPTHIIYPTGGGTGLIGMWKAFDEMEQLGWIGAKRPRMVSVQAAGCAPIVRAFEEGKRFADEFPDAATTASGLRVPRAIGDFLILDAIRTSGGAAVAVTDEALIKAAREIGSVEGLFVAPEGAACLPALRKLLAEGLVKEGDRVVLFNTGAGVKYLESYDE
jgi:threonine synthase